MPDLYAEMKAREGHAQRFLLDAILDSMPEDDKNSLITALEDADIPHVAVSDVLTANGYNVPLGLLEITVKESYSIRKENGKWARLLKKS